MARFLCGSCSASGVFRYDGRLCCPRCGSIAIQFALGFEELGDDEFLPAAWIREEEPGKSGK